MNTPVAARYASTVILARQARDRPEIFMVRRHHKNAFMANAYVFVGGRLDQVDCATTLTKRCVGRTDYKAVIGLDQDEHRNRGLFVAALRESFEESGVLLAERADGTALETQALNREREALNDKQRTFESILEQHDLRLRCDRLRYLARWVTPAFEPRRFDTFFFVAEVSRDTETRFDPRETTDGKWITIPEALAQARQRQLLLMPPTLCVLESLADCRTVDQLLAAAPDHPVPPIQPQPLRQASELTLLMPNDRRFDPADERRGEDYVVLRDGYWEHLVVPPAS
ncbi:MAG: hypothetical protein H6707_15150 [Deltaproteobacteria bacterium]|nr:hypothetical protein [Deltaproteobacteria bacterium]